MLSHNETTTAKFRTSHRLINRNFCSIKGMRSALENRKQSIVRKLALIVAVLSLVVMATIGVTFAQYVNTQNQNIIYVQTPQEYAGNSGYLPSDSGYCYSQIPQQDPYPFKTGIGMMGRLW